MVLEISVLGGRFRRKSNYFLGFVFRGFFVMLLVEVEIKVWLGSGRDGGKVDGRGVRLYGRRVYGVGDVFVVILENIFCFSLYVFFFSSIFRGCRVVVRLRGRRRGLGVDGRGVGWLRTRGVRGFRFCR